MNNRTLSDLKSEIFKTMKNLKSGKITKEDANKLDQQYTQELNTYNTTLSEVKKNLKNEKYIHTEAVLVQDLKLTAKDIEVAERIKEKLRKTAETIVEIGEEIAEAIKGKPRGFKELFYERIGMSSRSAQRYMQIARHVKVQELKQKKELDGKTMTDLLKLISQDARRSRPVNATNIANSFYSRYKNNPETLQIIMKELQKLIDNAR